jgi:hypothetical protein
MAVSVEQAGRVRGSSPPNHRDLSKRQSHRQTSVSCIFRTPCTLRTSSAASRLCARQARALRRLRYSRPDLSPAKTRIGECRRHNGYRLSAISYRQWHDARRAGPDSFSGEWPFQLSKLDESGAARRRTTAISQSTKATGRHPSHAYFVHLAHRALRAVFARDRPGRSEG